MGSLFLNYPCFTISGIDSIARANVCLISRSSPSFSRTDDCTVGGNGSTIRGAIRTIWVADKASSASYCPVRSDNRRTTRTDNNSVRASATRGIDSTILASGQASAVSSGIVRGGATIAIRADDTATSNSIASRGSERTIWVGDKTSGVSSSPRRDIAYSTCTVDNCTVGSDGSPIRGSEGTIWVCDKTYTASYFPVRGRDRPTIGADGNLARGSSRTIEKIWNWWKC